MIKNRCLNIKRAFRESEAVTRFSKYISQDELINSYLKQKRTPNRIILVESQQALSNQISLHTFLPLLGLMKVAGAISYTMMTPKPHSRVIEKIRNRSSLYYKFGCKRHILISSKSEKFWRNKYINQITDPYKLEKFSVEGVRIGDLIYDTYLRRTKNATIDLSDEDFAPIFDECVAYFFSMLEIFEQYEVAAVCVSHCVYHFGIPLRIAISKGIEVFQVTGEAIFRLSTKNTHAYTSFKYFREEINEISKNNLTNGLELAKASLDSRFAGILSEHMPYSTKSAYERNTAQVNQVLTPSSNLKILVAIHDFFDSPHSYGDNFYPDFQLWLTRLGEISVNTNYDWYIKTHRDPIGSPEEILKKFIKKYPKFQIINKDTDHHTLIEQGINLVLTVYGTIAMEYPYLGVPAINASLNNPHVAYNFSFTPRNLNEYEELLQNLRYFHLQISKDEIIEYYFMANYYQLRSITYLNYDDFLKSVGGYSASIGSEALDFYIANQEKIIPKKELVEAMSNFISSNDFQLSRKHFGAPAINWLKD